MKSQNRRDVLKLLGTAILSGATAPFTKEVLDEALNPEGSDLENTGISAGLAAILAMGVHNIVETPNIYKEPRAKKNRGIEDKASRYLKSALSRAYAGSKAMVLGEARIRGRNERGESVRKGKVNRKESLIYAGAIAVPALLTAHFSDKIASTLEGKGFDLPSISDILPEMPDFSEKKEKPGITDEEMAKLPDITVDLNFDENDYSALNRKKIDSSNRGLLKKKPQGEFFNTSAPSISIRGLNMIGEVFKYGVTAGSKREQTKGKLLRSLRFKNIADAVERKYSLPAGIVLSMVMEESGGADLLPNGRNDGGFGLSHMQPSIGHQFGLKIYGNNRKLVDKKHGRALRKEIEGANYDLRELSDKDDRLNRLLNLDAVGRMLAYHMTGPKIKRDGFRNLGPFATSIARYSGTFNYRKRYLPDLKRNMAALRDKKLIAETQRDFNKANQNMTINGEKSEDPFSAYTKAFQAESEGLFDLKKYKNQEGITFDSAEGVLDTYEKFMDL